MASKEGEGSEPRQFKTWVLKVSIHCEGCKKKVRRILQRCEGIQTIDIDSKQNKVTVTGNVEAETLIRKLLKSGKHAELWPTERKPKVPNPAPNSNDSGKEKNKVMKQNASKPDEQKETLEKKPEKSAKTATESETNNTKPAETSPDTKPAERSPKEKAQAEPVTVAAEKVTSTTKPSETETKSNAKISENGNKGPSKSDAKSENDAESTDTVVKSDNSGSKKDKKVAEDAIDAVQPTHHQPAYHQPAMYPQPVYVTGYNVVHPTPSYQYYAPAPTVPQSYIYLDHPPLEYHPNYARENYYGSMGYEASSSSQSQASYDYFNDENPNSCSVM